MVPVMHVQNVLCEPTVPHPASFHSAKMHKTIPSIIGQTPTKLKESQAVPGELQSYSLGGREHMDLSTCVKAIMSSLKSFHKLWPKLWHVGIYAALTQPEDRGVLDHGYVCSTHINQNSPAKKLQIKRCQVLSKLKCMRMGGFKVSFIIRSKNTTGLTKRLEAFFCSNYLWRTTHLSWASLPAQFVAFWVCSALNRIAECK